MIVTIIWFGKEKLEVELDREVGESTWRVKGDIYKRTSIGSTIILENAFLQKQVIS